MQLLIFLKALAQQLGLFDTPVDIQGHVRTDGVYVKPHTANRKKKLPQAKKHRRKKREDAAIRDLFSDTQDKPAYKPEKNTEKIAPTSKKGVSKRSKATTDPLAFGVSAGVSKTQRRRLNTAAIELLNTAKGAYTEKQKSVLRQYSGQGGVGDSLNEFYTRPDVSLAMWDILNKLGIDQGEVLEPSAGTGVFMHTAPDEIKLTGVELDSTSARIASALHGEQHSIIEGSLEQFATTDPRQFDAVVGNVPFGLRGAFIKEDKSSLKTAEQYFVDTAIDKTRDGGIVMLIVPTGIMDNKSTRAFRERVLRKAEFIGAHRMPNSAFEHSHTGVTTDIVIFRKRPTDVGQALGTVNRSVLKDLNLWDEAFLSGQYFSGRGKAQVYGRPEAGWRSKAGMGNDFTVTGSMRGVAQSLSNWVPEQPEPSPSMPDILNALGEDEIAKNRAISAALKSPYEVAQVGDSKVVDGVTYVLQGEPPRWHRADTDEEPESISQARDIAQNIASLVENEATEGEKNAEKARKQLIKDLDSYIAKHGIPANDKALILAAKREPALWRLIAAVNNDGSYSDLVTGKQRTLEGSFDAVAANLLASADSFSPDEVAQHWAKGDGDAALDYLFASQHYALNDDGLHWQSMDDYLSGELWSKYDVLVEKLKDSALSDEIRGQYEQQEKALIKAIDPKLLDDVEIMLNSGWIPLAMIEAFFNEKANQWKKDNPKRAWSPDEMKIHFESGLYTVSGGLFHSDLLEKYLNRAGVRRDDMPMINGWNEGFKQWLTSSEYREDMEDVYNRKFRGYREKTYSDLPMEVPGLNPALDVNAYHFEGLRWALDQGKGIIAADVGLGKTGRALMLSQLAKAGGQAKKPMIVVPKSVLANWMDEAEFWFPGSKVLTIGETVTKDKNGKLKSKSDNKAERDRKLHELAQNNYDFVLMSQPAWNDLDLNPITKGEYANSGFWVQRGDALGNAGDKRIRKIRESYEQALAGREFNKRTNAIYFDDLGVDMVILDEAHAYKNLYAVRTRFGESPKFLGGGGLSNRAQDTYFKSRWIRENNGGKGVFGLTATPTKNSPLEIYSMLSHIAPEAFDAIGIKNSEEFLDRFCEFNTENILTTSGDIAEALVTSGFKNMDELRDIMRRYIDRKTAEDVGLKLPERNDHQHLIDMSDEQEAVYEELRALAADDRGDAEGNAHIFSIMDKMGKASIDLELLGEAHKGARSPKIDTATAQVIEGMKEGGQIVFSDHISVHEKLKQALIKQGVKESEIAIVNAQVAKTSTQRQRISKQFNEGKIKVVIGNTATMGEGINLQKKTSDIHHLDLPWEPASMQQRNGRGLRQGNKNESIRIHTYLAKGSFDGYRYQTIAAKKDWQDLIWNGGDRIDNQAREGQFGRDEMLIMLSANPDEARVQYETSKQAATERAGVVKRKVAAERFEKFQQVKRSLQKLKNKTTQSGQRLSARVTQLRSQLKADSFFTAKDALDTTAPAVIQSETGVAYYKGVAFEMDAGKNTPIYYSETDKTKWVVTGVNKKTVEARPYGQPETMSTRFDLGKMHKGISPFAGYTPVQEQRHIAESSRKKEINKIIGSAFSGIKGAEVSSQASKATESAITRGRETHEWWKTKQARASMYTGIVDALQGALPESIQKEDVKALAQRMTISAVFADAGIPADIKSAADLKRVSSETQTLFNKELQTHLKRQVMAYTDNHQGPYALLDGEGQAMAFQSYDGRRQLDAHDLMLPTKENRQKALRAWVDMEKTKKIKTRYVNNSRRNSYGQGTPSGVQEAYPDWEYGTDTGNPWTRIGEHLFDAQFKADAEKMLTSQVAHQMKQAAGFGEALAASLPALKIKSNGIVKWSEPALKALWKRAIQDKALKKPLHAVLPEKGMSKEVFSVAHYAQTTNLRSDNVQDVLQGLAHASGLTDLATKIKGEAA